MNRPRRPITYGLCTAAAPLCPRCNRKVGRIQIPRDGAVLVTCATGRGGRRSRASCGQKLYILGVSGGMCLVLAISPEEYDAVRSDHREAAEILRDLGVLAEELANQNGAA